jgi:phospholipase C
MAVLAATTMLTGSIVPAAFAADKNDVATTTPIKHVVIIFAENITFDHYFATYPKAANPAGEPKFVAREDTPSVNGLNGGLLGNNPNKFAPFRLDRSEAFTCDQDHGYTDEQKATNGGAMDLFVQAVGRNSFGCRPDGRTVMGYFDGNTVTALWNYAQTYAMSDNSFGTTFGPSTPGALNLIAGQTHGAVIHPGPTDFGVFVDPVTKIGTVISDPDPFLDDCGQDKGGTNAAASTVEMTGHNVGDLLNKKGITWGWFQGGFKPTTVATFDPVTGKTITPAICASSHAGHPGVNNPSAANGNPTNLDIHGPIVDYNAHHAPFMYFASTRNPHHLRPNPDTAAQVGKSDQAKHQYDIADFFAALSAGNLPAVSYLKAANFQDGHPGNSDPLSEQAFIVQVSNALQQSPEWRETALFVSWDDSDGWYDHVTGPIVNPSKASVDSFVPAAAVNPATITSPGQIATSGNCGTPSAGAFQARCGYGPRLPLVLVSPWAKRNFVDHTTTDQSSMLRFIEDNWKLGGIDSLDQPSGAPAGQASFDQIAGSLLNMFDFDDEPHIRPLILDQSTGLVANDTD